mmetsp:Transcript_5158/g.14475  ORF Transcript_5158/g.14475 Transcript_5158/m.14475 type:complete len:90 (-) Transcript_5158:1732-2001(-)
MFAHALWMDAASGGPSKRAKLSVSYLRMRLHARPKCKNLLRMPAKKKGRHKPHLHITYFCGESSKHHRRTNFVLRTAQTAAIDLECSKP